MEKIYADYELDSSDMFVYTPEGNKISFMKEDGFDENHTPVTITDPNSNKNYLVIFDV